MDDWGFLTADGRVARLLRAVDWAGSCVGPPSGWPDLLRSTLATMLTSPQPMFLSWGPGLVSFYNDAYEPLLGGKAEGALGRAFPELWADIWADVAPIVERAYAGEGSRFEDVPLTMHRHGAPEATWWAFSYTPLRDAAGTVRGVLCVTAETSARVLAERHARAERERLAAMFEQAPIFMAMLDGPGHRIVQVNQAFRRVVGEREVLGRPLAEVADQGFVAILDRVWASGEAFAANDLLHAAPRAAGGPLEDRWLDVVFQPVRDGEGRVASVIVQGHDVTAAHESREVLRASEARFRTLFEAMDEAVMILERLPGKVGGPRDFRYAMLNGAARAAFGLPDAVGRSARALRPQAEEEWYAIFDQVLDTGEPARVERRSAPLGRVLEVYLAPIGGREERQLLTLTRDVTERWQAEDALRDANQSLERRVNQRTAELRLLANIVDTTDAFVQVVDQSFRWLGINRAAADECERVYGVRPRLGDSLLDLLGDRPAQREALRAAWSRALGGTPSRRWPRSATRAPTGAPMS